MKRLVGVILALGLVLGSLTGLAHEAIAASGNSFTWNAFSTTPLVAAEFRNKADDKLGTDFGKKIDLNNTNVRAFLQYPGMYPTLARMIVQNAPFDDMEDIFDMPDLSERQKEVLQANLDNFTLSPPEDTFVEGGDRFNNGIYR